MVMRMTVLRFFVGTPRITRVFNHRWTQMNTDIQIAEFRLCRRFAFIVQ